METRRSIRVKVSNHTREIRVPYTKSDVTREIAVPVAMEAEDTTPTSIAKSRKAKGSREQPNRGR